MHPCLDGNIHQKYHTNTKFVLHLLFGFSRSGSAVLTWRAAPAVLSHQSSEQQQPVCNTPSHLPTPFFQQRQLSVSISALLLISLLSSSWFSPRSLSAVSTLFLIFLEIFIFLKLTLLKGSNVWRRISWKVISAGGMAFCVRFLLSQEFYSQQCINEVFSICQRPAEKCS